MDYIELCGSILTEHITAPVVPEGCVEIGIPLALAKRRLQDHKFDYGLVRQNGATLGLVCAADLREDGARMAMEAPVRKLMLDDVIPHRTPMQDLIQYLTKAPFNVVVRGKEVIGVVDWSDLNKNPVYVYFYALLSLLEQHLLVLARGLPRETNWEALIGCRRLADYKQRVELAVQNNQELDPLSYLNFADYLKIVGRSPGVLSNLGFCSKTQWDGQVGSLYAFRNDVMHPVHNLVGSHRTVRELCAMDHNIRKLMGRIKDAFPHLTDAGAK